MSGLQQPIPYVCPGSTSDLGAHSPEASRSVGVGQRLTDEEAYRAKDTSGYSREERAAQNARTNAVSAIAYRLAGGSHTFYNALDKDDRLAIRAEAAEIYAQRYAPPPPVPLSSRAPLPASKRFGPFPTFKRKLLTRPVPLGLARRPSRPSINTPGFVYILVDWLQYKEFGVLKIGLTSDLKARVTEANAWGKYEYLDFVAVSDMGKAEADMHHIFHADWDTRERFKADKDQARAVLALVARRYPPTEDPRMPQ